MGELLLFTSTIILCIVIYIIYKNDNSRKSTYMRSNDRYQSYDTGKFRERFPMNDSFDSLSEINCRPVNFDRRAKYCQSPGNVLRRFVDQEYERPQEELREIKKPDFFKKPNSSEIGEPKVYKIIKADDFFSKELSADDSFCSKDCSNVIINTPDSGSMMSSFVKKIDVSDFNSQHNKMSKKEKYENIVKTLEFTDIKPREKKD